MAADGTALVEVPLDDLGVGRIELRAVAGGVASETSQVQVTPPAVVTAPGPDDTLVGTFTAEVAVDPALSPTAVRLFVDGSSVPDPATHAGDGTWRVDVDPAALGVTHRHVDLVAQVRTADGRASARRCGSTCGRRREVCHRGSAATRWSPASTCRRRSPPSTSTAS